MTLTLELVQNIGFKYTARTDAALGFWFNVVAMQAGAEAYHIKGGHSKDLIRVVGLELLQGFHCNGDSGVDWVGYDIQ